MLLLSIALAQPLTTKELAPGVWMHTSHRPLPDLGPFPANGLILKTEKGSVIIDAAWGVDTEVLLKRAEDLAGPVQAIIVTHSHDDRTHDLAVARDRNIPVWGLPRTSALLVADQDPPLDHVATGSLEALGLKAQLLFPGHGHSSDNAVLWLEEPRLLFGGCFVKSADSKNLGNTTDADLGSWYSAIIKLEKQLTDIETVVPGHGDPGTKELLSHTRALLLPSVGPQ